LIFSLLTFFLLFLFIFSILFNILVHSTNINFFAILVYCCTFVFYMFGVGVSHFCMN
jgi:hypothetical protein